MICRKTYFVAYTITCLFLQQDQCVYAQKNFIRTDLVGYAYPQLTNKWARQYQQIKFSLAYERGMKNPHLSFGLNIGYGGMMEYGYSHEMHDDFGKLYFISNFINYQGVSAFFDFRYFNPFRKKTFLIDHPEKAYSGVFIGIYGAGLHLKGTLHSFMRSWDQVSHDAYTVTQGIVGIGGVIGYKQRIRKKYFFDLLYGNAVELSGVNLTGFDGREPDPRKKLRRLELSVGYAF